MTNGIPRRISIHAILFIFYTPSIVVFAIDLFFFIINNLSQKEKRVALTTKNKRLASGQVAFRQLSYIFFLTNKFGL